MVTLRHPQQPKSSPQADQDARSPSDSHWSPTLQTTLDQPASTLPLQLACAGLAFSGLFIAWTWLGRVDDVARAAGKLVPQNQAYQVHPVESGKVVKVAVKEGETVHKGDVLIELDPELAEKEIERLQTQLTSAKEELMQTQSLIESTQMQAQVQVAIAQTAIAAHRMSIRENEQSVQTQQSLTNQLSTDIDAQQARLSRIKPLVDEGAIARDRVFEIEQGIRDRQRSITESSGSLQKSQTEIDRLEVELAQKQQEAEQVSLGAQQKVQELQIKAQGLRATLQETEVLIAAAQERLKQRYVYSPVDGTVLSLHVKGQGSVVQMAQPIAEIAPQGKPLVLSALLPSQKAGFVKVGMSVKLKLDAYPYQDYGVISGKVLTISPDSHFDEKLGQVYHVDVSLDRPYIQAKGQQIPLKAGQTGTVEIITRHRRILDVLLDPLKKLRGTIDL